MYLASQLISALRLEKKTHAVLHTKVSASHSPAHSSPPSHSFACRVHRGSFAGNTAAGGRGVRTTSHLLVPSLRMEQYLLHPPLHVSVLFTELHIPLVPPTRCHLNTRTCTSHTETRKNTRTHTHTQSRSRRRTRVCSLAHPINCIKTKHVCFIRGLSANRAVNSPSQLYKTSILTLWRRNFLLNFSTPCI